MTVTTTTTTTSSAAAITGTNGTTTTDADATMSQKEGMVVKEIFRSDHRPLPFTVSTIHLDINIHPGITTVTSQFVLRANDNNQNALVGNGASSSSNTLVLNGDDASLTLVSFKINGQTAVEQVDYRKGPDEIILLKPQSGDLLDIVVTICPENNTLLSGLYQAGPIYCTQCEAMGFRRITYYPDRPDNMAIFERVRIEANQDEYPILLSNGNRMEEGVVVSVDSNETPVVGGVHKRRHYAIWSDPFPKPSYLFAAVAGNLASIQDVFMTRSGREVQLQVYSEHKYVHKLQYALDSLKRAMRWDEDRFGLEYDLDLYNIVAVDSFNMGAMENKGLNVFNTSCVLADQVTATDVDFERVEGVIGHEYFHNWTGNRVTCQDWFQLTLKEGLTVFRDQEFSGDLNSKAVKRIEDVRSLRGRQFSEDAGPMAHPIRPESYISMDNFYTATVYSKGAEVIRMYQTLLTRDGFNRGMKLYFERHDGSAVTCDDFLAAMADANKVDLSQFARWYSTPGTPVVQYSTDYKDGTFSLTMTQSSRSDLPLHIPVAVGLLDKSTGDEVVSTTVLELKEKTQTFTFENLKGPVVLSVLRDFSAPIKIAPESGKQDEEELAFLAARDTDGFNRWEAGQKLYTSLIFQTMKKEISDKTVTFVEAAFGRALANRETTDHSILAYTLVLPSESTLAEEMDVADPIGIHEAREAVKKSIARRFESELNVRYEELTTAMEKETEFKVDAQSIGRRRLRNVLLGYLCSLRDSPAEEMAAAELAMNHFTKANGMTDKIAALAALVSMDGKGALARDEALQKFYDDANGDSLVLDKWFAVQAMADLPDVLDRVKLLAKHPDFTLRTPNRCRALVTSFVMNNPAAFHDLSGAGYQFLTEILLEVDKLNPVVSSRMAKTLISWRRYGQARGELMKAQLEKLASHELSKDLYEIVSHGLK